MGAISNNILTITEPTIVLEAFDIIDVQSGNAGSESSTNEPTNADRTKKQDNMSKLAGGAYPSVRVNGYDFNKDHIVHFEMDLNSFLPTATIVINDSRGLFSAGQYPKDGDALMLYIRSSDEEIYKPIRMDFDILSVEAPPVDAESQSSPGDRSTNPNVSPMRYTFECRIKIPGLYKDICKSYSSGTLFTHLEEISSELKIGFASNVDDTSDEMTRVCAYDNRFKFIKEQILSAYKSDNHFFVGCIDPYYYLNLVDLNNQLKYDEELEDTLTAMTIDLTGDANYGSEQNQGETKLYLTNVSKGHVGTDKYILAYSLQNNAAQVTQDNGYKRIMKYYDAATREYLTFDVEPLTSESLPQGMAPLKGKLDEDRYQDEVKYKYVGKQSANVHENYLFAQIHNYQNVTELEKLYLTVELEKANMTLYKFQRIPIIIYDNSTMKNESKKQKEKKTEDLSGSTGDVDGSSIKSEKADNITDQYGAPQLDKYLTGIYVIAGIEYEYKKGYKGIKQKLKLYRREWPNPV
jgi:hypothetical protein